MTDSEWRAFVLEGTRTGKAGVTRKDGTPHVTPIWFVLDGDDLLFTTYHESIKARVLARDPRQVSVLDIVHLFRGDSEDIALLDRALQTPLYGGWKQRLYELRSEL